ncbi:hypothetical protein LCGC14_0895130, partial [marine sediment metagenome]
MTAETTKRRELLLRAAGLPTTYLAVWEHLYATRLYGMDRI